MILYLLAGVLLWWQRLSESEFIEFYDFQNFIDTLQILSHLFYNKNIL